MSPLDARRADAEARRLAQLRFDTPIVMEAGAGTGKTAVLVARVIAWSLGPGWERSEAALSSPDADAVAARVLRRVVAITFTEAAAAEMAARAAEYLLLLERGEPPVGLSLAALQAEGEGAGVDERVRARARALLGVLDQLRVQSIHAWCRSLLASHPLEAGLHPRFEVDPDGAARREVVREVLERFLAERFDREVDPDVLALAEAGVGPSALGRALEELLEAGVLPGFLATDPFGPDAIGALLDRTRGVIAGFRAAEDGRLTDLAKIPVALMSHLAETGEAIDALSADQEGLEALIDIAGDWPKNLIDRLTKWRGGGFGKGESEALGDRQDALAEAAGVLRALLLHLRVLEPAHLERGMRVLHPLLAEASEALRRRGAVGFHTLLSGTRDLLRDHPAVAAAERAGIDQLLVDEFQDTDRLQCDIVVALALTGPPAQRPGLFIVGDPKQSIYGWRNADLRAYDAFLHEALAGAERRRLSVNYRSSGALLDEVERAVSPVMEEQAGVQPRFEPLLAHQPEEAEQAADPPVEYWVSWPLSEDGRPTPRPRSRDATALEARAIAADLARRQADGRLCFGDVALLMRSQGDLDRYLEALRAAGVPYTVDGERSYYRRREVVDASALVRSILDPNDLLALVTYLRSPWVGVPDAAWVPLFARGLPDLARSLFGEPGPVADEMAGLVESAAKALPSGVPGLAELAGWGDSLVDALDGLARLRECFATAPADTFVETLRAGLLVEAIEAARYLGAHRVAGLDRFFRELLVALEAGGGDAPRVLRGLREAIAREPDPFAGPPRDPGEDAVRVMTIHRAKGLDFGEVYLLQHHKGARHGEPPDREVVLPSDLAEGEFKLFGACTLGFDRVLAAETAREQAELVRTLYVAMTRAKRRLVVAGAWGEPVAAPRQAASHQQLLACRVPLARVEEHMLTVAAAGDSHFDDAGARFVFPGLLEAGAAARTAHVSGRGAADADELASAARDIAGLRAKAEARARLQLARPASQDSPAEEREQLAEERFATESSVPLRFAGRSRERATVVGSAVHRALELLDPAGLPLLERPRCDEVMQQVVVAALPPARVDEALSEAHALLDRFFDGPLHRRFCAIGPGIVARELPVLLAAEDDSESPGYVVGAVDLVYRDPADGAWVVADWKTDTVPARVAASRYRAQLQRYLRAVQGALGLPEPPRGELWFLTSGQVL